MAACGSRPMARSENARIIFCLARMERVAPILGMPHGCMHKCCAGDRLDTRLAFWPRPRAPTAQTCMMRQCKATPGRPSRRRRRRILGACFRRSRSCQISGSFRDRLQICLKVICLWKAPVDATSVRPSEDEPSARRHTKRGRRKRQRPKSGRSAQGGEGHRCKSTRMRVKISCIFCAGIRIRICVADMSHMLAEKCLIHGVAGHFRHKFRSQSRLYYPRSTFPAATPPLGLLSI